MSRDTNKLLKITCNYEKIGLTSLIIEAKKKEKLDPKAKVRNRGTVCVPAASAKDKKDHFPINDEGQARSALSRVEGLTSAPWYSGSLEGLRALVKRKVHAKYPSIGKTDKKKKSSLEVGEALLNKYAQVGPAASTTGKVPAQDAWGGALAPQTPDRPAKPLNQLTPEQLAKQFPGASLDAIHGRGEITNEQYNAAYYIQHPEQQSGGAPTAYNPMANPMSGGPTPTAPQSPGAKPVAPAAKPKQHAKSDPWIKAMQKFLTSKGFPLIDDGVMGPNTSNALQRWQTDEGLPTSGKLDQATISALTPQLQPHLAAVSTMEKLIKKYGNL